MQVDEGLMLRLIELKESDPDKYLKTLGFVREITLDMADIIKEAQKKMIE